MRKKIVVGNWKLNGNLHRNQVLISDLIIRLKDINHADFVICLPYTYLFQAQNLLTGTNIKWGAQNVSQFDSGTYTSSISAPMIAEFGCEFVIIGHSERRSLSNESDQKAARRVSQAVKSGITPIYCVGETLADRTAGNAKNIVKNQILAITHGLEDAVFENVKQVKTVIAYEPAWAIGNGKTADPEQAQEMHAFIRALIAKVDVDFSKQIRIIYGGSMSPMNANALLSMPDVDGGLIGQCSLSSDEFSQICYEANKT